MLSDLFEELSELLLEASLFEVSTFDSTLEDSADTCDSYFSEVWDDCAFELSALLLCELCSLSVFWLAAVEEALVAAVAVVVADTVAAVDELSFLLPQPVITLANDVDTTINAAKSVTDAFFALWLELFIKSFLI